MNPELTGSPWNNSLLYYTIANVNAILKCTENRFSVSWLISCVLYVLRHLRQHTVKKYELGVLLRHYVVTVIVLMGPLCSVHSCPLQEAVF